MGHIILHQSRYKLFILEIYFRNGIPALENALYRFYSLAHQVGYFQFLGYQKAEVFPYPRLEGYVHCLK